MKYFDETPHPDRLRLFLFRHGHLENSEKSVINGSTDIPLSEIGRKQMHFWKEKLSPFSFQDFISSDLSRTLEGIAILAQGRNATHRKLSGFRERSFGIWEGKTRSQIASSDPEGYALWQKVDLSFSPPEGESLSTFRSRIHTALERFIAETGFGRNVLMVGHSGVNRVLLLRALGVPLENYFRFSQDYAALNIIDFYRAGPPVVLLLNRLPDVEEAMHG